jgi:DNA-binding CsgD family transcriptional regulator
MRKIGVADPPVTDRESEILAWIAAGKSDWQIGRILELSPKTVNFHVENAKRKFGVATRVQAVLAAERRGLLRQLMDG